VAADTRVPRRIVWLARAGGLLIRALGWTWRIRVTDNDALLKLRAANQPFIYVLWHGQLLPLLYQHRNEGVAILISEHGDGEIVARIAESLGLRTVRGSTSRGAARSLLNLTRELREGRGIAITPDGPRGPAKSFAPGALIIAQRTGAPLVGAAASASSGWRLKSWDSFLIPRPFARVHIAYSDVAFVQSADARGAAAEADRVRQYVLMAEERANG
jgi:lysophospholipid acyltransferase (LPLAT)-like uncharacterized protein